MRWKKLKQKISRREVSKQNSNRNKRNRKHRKNGYRKSYKPKIYFGTIISDREENTKRDDTKHQRRDKLEKQTLPPRPWWQIRQMGRKTPWYTNGKLKIVQNRKQTASDTEEEDDYDDDEEMPEEIGTPHRRYMIPQNVMDDMHQSGLTWKKMRYNCIPTAIYRVRI